MPSPFNPYDAGDPEAFDALEPVEPVAWRERSEPPPVSEEESSRASDFSSLEYDPLILDSVWENGDSIPGNDSDLWRKDQFGAWMHRHSYGKRHSEFGWEICDLSAVRGPGGIAALRPMQWQNYVDQVAALTRSRVTADGLRNVRKLV